MIIPKHSKFSDFIFSLYLERLFANHFFSFHILNSIPNMNPEYPVLLLPNHSSWWDGFFVYYLNQKIFKKKLFLMMLEDQLVKNSFFSKLGVYSIDPTRIHEIKNSVQYTINLLNNKNSVKNLICWFPQGELLPFGRRPLDFKKGIELVTKHIETPVNIMSLVIKIEYQREQRASVFFMLENQLVQTPGVSINTNMLEKKTDSLCNKVSDMINNDEKGYIIFKGKQSVNKTFLNIRKFYNKRWE